MRLRTFVLLAAILAWFGHDGARAQITPPPSGGSVCTLSGTQTTGYVLTATNGGTSCAWQTVGGASVDNNTLKNAAFIQDLSVSANSITGTTATAFPGAYAKGQSIIVQVANTNTGATTINITNMKRLLIWTVICVGRAPETAGLMLSQLYNSSVLSCTTSEASATYSMGGRGSRRPNNSHGEMNDSTRSSSRNRRPRAADHPRGASLRILDWLHHPLNPRHPGHQNRTRYRSGESTGLTAMLQHPDRWAA